jgi:Zn-dependent alcohol dehydrogenase
MLDHSTDFVKRDPKFHITVDHVGVFALGFCHTCLQDWACTSCDKGYTGGRKGAIHSGKRWMCIRQIGERFIVMLMFAQDASYNLTMSFTSCSIKPKNQLVNVQYIPCQKMADIA